MPIKVNGYSNYKKNAKALKRQKEADIRQLDYEELTKNEKIALIKSRPGASKKELAKVLKTK